MNYWVMKSEPSVYGIDDLIREPHQTDYWDGVRNYQARNMLRDQCQIGDLAFFYHSNTTPPGIVGIMKIVKSGYPDTTAFDLNSQYYDPKSDPNNPRWYRVDVRCIRKFKQLIPLETLKQIPALSPMPLLRKGNRLSITPVTPEAWEIILSLEG